MIKKMLIPSFFFVVYLTINAQIHRDGEMYCTDTVFLNNQNKNAYYILSLVISLDSINISDGFEKEYYTYHYSGRYHDPNLTMIDTTVFCSNKKIMFMVKNNMLFFTNEESKAPVFAEIKSHRRDSVLFILNSPFLLFGFSGSKITIEYIPKDHSYSSINIRIDHSLFFKRLKYDYGVGFTIIELENACDFGSVILYRKE